jgi:hypothetical protein
MPVVLKKAEEYRGNANVSYPQSVTAYEREKNRDRTPVFLFIFGMSSARAIVPIWKETLGTTTNTNAWIFSLFDAKSETMMTQGSLACARKEKRERERAPTFIVPPLFLCPRLCHTHTFSL